MSRKQGYFCACALIGIVVAAWALLLRLIWRARLFERLLDLEGS